MNDKEFIHDFARRYPFITKAEAAAKLNNHQRNRTEKVTTGEIITKMEDVGTSLVQRNGYIINDDGRERSIISKILRETDLTQDELYELAHVNFDSEDLLRELVAVQVYRLKKGMAFEESLDLGPNENVEATLSNLVNMLKSIHDIRKDKSEAENLSDTLAGLISQIENEEENEEENILDTYIVGDD